MTRKILWLALGVLAVACGDATEERASARGASGAASAPPAERPVVLFLGTSLTAGYGLDVEQAYPALVQQKIDRAGLEFRVVNAGVSGETSAGGLRRIDWLLREPVAVLVLELGANDGLRGLDPEAMRENLREIIVRTKEANPEVRIVIAGMSCAPKRPTPRCAS
jgi:acyl-CoA thioesterase-1